MGRKPAYENALRRTISTSGYIGAPPKTRVRADVGTS
jgi:hypothetical protein